MKMKYLLILSMLLSSCWWSVEAQESEKPNQLNINMQLRPRAEYRNGYQSPMSDTDKSAGFISQRSRLSLAYSNEHVSTFMSVQNVNTWGQNAIANSSANALVNEAWAQVKSSNGLFMKFGRQQLHYNDGRLFAHSDWNQAGFFHDALKLGYLTKEHQLDLVLALNQEQKNKGGTYFNGAIPYKTMQLLNYQYNEMASFTPSFMFTNMGYEVGTPASPETAYLQTLGVNLIFNPIKELRLQGTAYYQMGEGRQSTDKVSAYMMALRADYNIDKVTKVFAGLDFLSGEESNSPNSNSTFNAFNTLHAGNHAFYGAMDVFIASGYLSGMNLGVFDKYVGVTYTPQPKYQFLARFHHLSMAADAYDNGDKVKKGMASEIDLQFDYTIMKNVRLICGYSTLFGTESLKFAKGGDPKVWQDWAFVSINVNPQIFSSKW